MIRGLTGFEYSKFMSRKEWIASGHRLISAVIETREGRIKEKDREYGTRRKGVTISITFLFWSSRMIVVKYDGFSLIGVSYTVEFWRYGKRLGHGLMEEGI